MKSHLVITCCLILIFAQTACLTADIEPTPSPAQPEFIDGESPSSNRQTNAVRPLWTADEPDPGAPNTAMETDLYAAEAPEFPDDLVWLQADQYTPVRLADVRGNVVILMFWSYECIDCIYHFQDLHRLQTEHPDRLTIISIHSAKLASDDDLVRVQQTIANYQAHYPTINDHDQRLWYKWGVPGIPTFIVIDPVGIIYGIHNGEQVYGTFKPIMRLFDKSDKSDKPDKK